MNKSDFFVCGKNNSISNETQLIWGWNKHLQWNITIYWALKLTKGRAFLFWSKSISWVVSRHRAGSEDFPSRGSRCTDCSGLCSFCSFRSGLGSEQHTASCYSLHKTATTENGKITNPGKHCLDFYSISHYELSFCWAFLLYSFFPLLPFGVTTVQHLFAISCFLLCWSSPFLLSSSSIIIILSTVSPLSLLSTCPNHLNLASLILSPNLRCPADFLTSNPVYPCCSKRKNQHPLLWTVDELKKKKSSLYTHVFCIVLTLTFILDIPTHRGILTNSSPSGPNICQLFLEFISRSDWGARLFLVLARGIRGSWALRKAFVAGELLT